MDKSKYLSLLVTMLWTASAHAAPVDLKPTAGRGSVTCTLPATKAHEVFVVAVDRTSVRNAQFNARIVDAIGNVLSKPGVRAIMWAFGGSRYALPSVIADITTPAVAKERQSIGWLVNTALSPSGAPGTATACIAEKAEELRASFLSKLKSEVEKLDDGTTGASPIVLAIDQGVAPFATETRAVKVQILVISDGLEYGGSKDSVSFYPLEGRFLSPNDAVSKTSRIGSAWKDVRVTMAGLGVTPSQDVATVSALVEIWKAIITARQGIVGELTTSTPQRLID